ncbi:3',5'-cyclic-AMP phosphodiesterase 4D-like [Phascolarctos cinereus]|uniref:cAMP-specific 3',5'-cyclic phosphodiesterase 4D-like isoform X1 n=1 Tax=Phascolarctos cinereus TaxID=38626 RepID=A0A6P5M317_PHACI|nr:cAMP-specific 3',5'-cyclic phosphodiesterase 4D-like isoform X1 [Phascolarctos cinereus]
MEKNKSDLLSRSKSASEETLHSSNEGEDPFRGMEPYLVRRLSCRNVQLPPLAFRQLEQADLKSESENLQRPTSLPLKILPLIAITSAESSSLGFSDLWNCMDFKEDSEKVLYVTKNLEI